MSKSRQPTRQARLRVEAAFDPEMLAHICTTWDFDRYAKRYDLEPGRYSRERFYYYQDNGSDILAVAHLDSVQDDGTCSIMNTSAGPLVVSGTLDDRLGVYVILELLPKLGITCDWLLTTDEEMGQSTAGDFDTGKEYKWMFQFDRGGTDVVMYDYETKQLCDLVEDSGARVGNGSFSDICMLEHLGCAGFNWGVGYRDYHGPRSHAWLNDTFRMVARFVKFYRANVEKEFVYVPRWARAATSGSIVKSDDESFWTGLLVADCGHYIDVDDEDSFIDLHGKFECRDCGTVREDLTNLGETA
jgi:hypothetical protein